MTKENYFELRNVDLQSYVHYKIPAYLLNILPNKSERILDFGCGFGQLLDALKSSGFNHVEGADINQAAIESLRIRQTTVHDLSSANNFFTDYEEKYDTVIMSHVLEHIAKTEIVALLSSISGLIKPGGRLIVMVPNAQSNTGCYWAYEDFTHQTLFTGGSLYYVLRSSGFKGVEFIDIDCLSGIKGYKKILRKLLLNLFKINYKFWNKVTGSATHKPSPQIFSYEIKAIARK
jgi:2-polyprenyl-3-methyl-5-hydroxy-6-metoxy-1,4-benzoquinol methylase